MNKVTERISKVISITNSDMTIYVAGDDKLCSDIRSGWPKRNVVSVPYDTTDMSRVGLLIVNNDSFVINYW